MSETTTDEDRSADLPVADRVLTKYIRALCEDPAMESAAIRMEAALLTGKPITEQSLRQALFGEPAE